MVIKIISLFASIFKSLIFEDASANFLKINSMVVIPLVEFWTKVFNFLFGAPLIPLYAQVANWGEMGTFSGVAPKVGI